MARGTRPLLRNMLSGLLVCESVQLDPRPGNVLPGSRRDEAMPVLGVVPVDEITDPEARVLGQQSPSLARSLGNQQPHMRVSPSLIYAFPQKGNASVDERGILPHSFP